MQNELNKQKQEADEDSAPKNVEQDGYTAAELGEESSYNDSTETAQQIRRGDEDDDNDGDDRDVVGSTTSADESDNKAVPRHQRGEDDAADKNPETPEN